MCKELEIEQAHLDARGVRDVKFFWGSCMPSMNREDLCKEVARILKEYRLGNCKPMPPIGDRLLTHIGDKS